MIFENKDNISHLSFQLLYKGSSDGLEIKKTTERLVERGFLPALQTLMDKYSPTGSLLSIDSIICDVEVSERDFNAALTQKIIAEIEKQLVDKIDSSDQQAGLLTGETRFAEALLFYLKNGFLPWFANISTRTQLNELVAALVRQGMTDDSIGAVIQQLKFDAVILRICNDFDEQVFWAFIALLTGSKSKQLLDTWRVDYYAIASAAGMPIDAAVMARTYKKSLLKSIAAYGRAASAQSMAVMNHRFAKLFVSELASEIKSPEIVEQLTVAGTSARLRNKILADHLGDTGLRNDPKPENGAKPDIEMETKSDEISQKHSNEPIYINNSGLVIIGPYLTLFFKRLAVVEDNKIVNPSKAVTLLHYIATGTESFAEFEVVLPKLLCGFEPDFAIPASYQITTGDMDLVDELLKSVISHWTILKNTSVTGLRETFLLREGKLISVPDGSRLKVQRNTIDVLLEQLPWSISMIKLPWMTKLLTVDWL